MLGQGKPYRYTYPYYIYLCYQKAQIQDKSLYNNWTLMIKKALFGRLSTKVKTFLKKGKPMGNQSFPQQQVDTRIWEAVSTK